jgi:uncharacterized protein YhbP (UPF0306 family)
MDVNKLIKQHLAGGRMMQIATVSGDQPWICTVYYVEDEQLNLYWLSFPSRRHSQEIADHGKVAVAVPIKFDKPVIGVQAEGLAMAVTDKAVVGKTMKLYSERHNSGHNFYDSFIAGANEHVLYKFTPCKMFLFDEVNFPGGQRQEWQAVRQ